MALLVGKNILVLIPRGKTIYGTAVYDELTAQGAQVDVYDERPSQSTSSKIAYRVLKSEAMNNRFRRYLDKVLQQQPARIYDYVLIVRGEAFSSETIGYLKQKQPHAKYILYLWDSLLNNDKRSIFGHFDAVFSFDSVDCQKEEALRFRPLFYINEYREVDLTHPREFDISFIGTIHSYRYHFAEAIKKQADSAGLRTFYYYYFPSKVLFHKAKLQKVIPARARSKDFHFRHMTLDTTVNYIASSKASIDAQHPRQSGLTMRTMEILGSRRKLITTNQLIREYDFYQEQNIQVVDAENPEISTAFINEPYREIDESIYRKYSIQGWVEHVFSVD